MDNLIKRYDIPIMDGVMLGRGDDPNGEWVRYDDHANALAEAQETIARMEAAIAYVLDGYGLNAPDFKRQPEDDEDDWIVEHLRAALSPREG